ncbi:hypothetical protein [Vibrio parahaemolyticus]|uniref:hypothetical protein n=1 Tax=Vibrio parahaemolyticus TaxID=670 RepID=UPI0023610012|nr:hypothetical protein [Vibrio parahaemolyticus]
MPSSTTTTTIVATKIGFLSTNVNLAWIITLACIGYIFFASWCIPIVTASITLIFPIWID